ncbi:MAG TPA: UDP-N-acetylmuramoyl-L-alanine--D-glutamate ligase [Ignavibacteriaceae bacterium]|nr:UDP-N-acetylmuramoyl-L-alanine--D-glutamate ligase [Ignavibacteriaceae bacterium]
MDKKISVIGAARSGIGAARLIKKMGGIPFVSDSGSDEKLKESVNVLSIENIEYETGKHSEKIFDCDFMIISPGVPADAEVIKKAKNKRIKMFSEVELASRFCKGKIIAITGTNGKTTTTSLCGHVFESCRKKTYVAGNIGLAFSEIASDVKENEFVVLEVSSFQLDLIEKFKPVVAVILNITPDHLNRYENSVEKYALSKQRIYENQDQNDYLVVNGDDETTLKFLSGYKSKSFLFSLNEEQQNGCYVTGNQIISKKNNSEIFCCSIDDITIRGEHNVANAMAVIIIAKIFDLHNEGLKEALKTFQGVEHRLEFVREIDGIKFINDSKATNVDSVWYALRSFSEPIFLILGGQDKGNDYEKIKQLIIDKVQKIYAIGSSAEKVFNFFHSFVKVEIKESLEEVASASLSEAREGDVVLLSPACASFDMFDNYEHRGRVFKNAVNNL